MTFLIVENSAQTSFRFSPVSFRAPRLGWYNTNRIISIYVTLPKVAKDSKEGAIHIGLWCDIARDIAVIIALNLANVNTAKRGLDDSNL